MELAILNQYKDITIFFGILTLLVILYLGIANIIHKSQMKNDQKRRTISNIRTGFLFVVAVSFFVLWARELYQFVLSIAAIGAALAIAFKEVFMCFTGSFYRTFAHPFSVGDRIQIADIRGDVVNVGLMSTQILEVGPKDYTHQFTGRMLSIPNSMFLNHTIYNETDNVHDDDQDFALHVFMIPVENNKNWKTHKRAILDSAREICKDFIEPANAYFTKMAKKRHVDVPWIEPRINIRIKKPGELEFIVRVTVPVSMKGTTEQSIVREYLTKIHS